jgi:hypothetical protein
LGTNPWPYTVPLDFGSYGSRRLAKLIFEREPEARDQVAIANGNQLCEFRRVITSNHGAMLRAIAFALSQHLIAQGVSRDSDSLKKPEVSAKRLDAGKKDVVSLPEYFVESKRYSPMPVPRTGRYEYSLGIRVRERW